MFWLLPTLNLLQPREPHSRRPLLPELLLLIFHSIVQVPEQFAFFDQAEGHATEVPDKPAGPPYIVFGRG